MTYRTAGLISGVRTGLLKGIADTAATILTPIATPTNVMVMGTGGYTFSEYWKLGPPLLAWFFVVSVFVVPLI